MDSRDVEGLVSSSLTGRWLLDHPFYRRWEEGSVQPVELTHYAAQYRHFESYLPQFLERLVAVLPEGAARDLIVANLADENGDPVPHVELFEGFAKAVGAPVSGVSPAMEDLLTTYAALLEEGAVPAISGFLAYECQAAAVAGTKASCLRRHHGLDDAGVAFWEHHAKVDILHRQWAYLAVGQIAPALEAIGQPLRLAADAWWGFLDEREIVP